ncbi:hypothetical protein FNU76_10320 [Chitinimonas arctica]|uniref:Uncharacterized protein n=1 Tax=Chitinimonas arctica TaxID=2594795 RepID=A0A516SFD0_9NEIS|nr:hypothetical protein [Chitinimonas arctica]QDQ26728.1 hypothetical protein FNU76_10320 [Chitinimonas arctica]
MNWIKWLVAEKELIELHAWRLHHTEVRRWLAEFPDVADTLDHMHTRVYQLDPLTSICQLRATMRVRQSEKVSGVFWPRLTAPAKVGEQTFGKGVSTRIVIDAAQRRYLHRTTPEAREAVRMALLRDPEMASGAMPYQERSVGEA